MNTKDYGYLSKNIGSDSKHKKTNNFISTKEQNKSISNNTKTKENFTNKKIIGSLNCVPDKKQKTGILNFTKTR